jgi:hypothetical protein
MADMLWRMRPLQHLNRAAKRVYLSMTRRGWSHYEALPLARMKHVGMRTK